MIVSFAVVAFNEEQTLPKLLADLKNQDYPHEKIEVLLIDSMSKDRTREIMENFAKEEKSFLRILVLENRKKNIPSGNNVALNNYSGDAIIRLDAHATMPREFLRKNVEVLKSGEYCSGGKHPNIIDKSTPWKEALLSAEQSMFGSSIASYRRSDKKMYTSSLFCGMYRREVFDKVGLYNEHLARTEDNDINYRIREAGFKLCYSPDIIYYQHARNTLKKMLRQKYLNGYWIGLTMGVNPKCFSVFHFVPFLFVMGIIFTTLLALFGMPLLSYLMWGLYVLFLIAMSALEMVKAPSFAKLSLPFLFLALHVSYGAGTLIGLIKMPICCRKFRNRIKE